MSFFSDESEKKFPHKAEENSDKEEWPDETLLDARPHTDDSILSSDGGVSRMIKVATNLKPMACVQDTEESTNFETHEKDRRSHDSIFSLEVKLPKAQGMIFPRKALHNDFFEKQTNDRVLK